MDILGIDIGGSGIKAGLVNSVSGILTSEPITIPTPSEFTQTEILGAITTLVGIWKHKGPIGIGFPSAVIDGIIQTPPTTFDHKGWIGYSLKKGVENITNCETEVINDADAVGIAEMKYGAGKGKDGLVMVFTLGTGIGSALFIKRHLVPNTLLGHIYLYNSTVVAEKAAAARIINLENLSWEVWGKRLNEYINHIDHVFSPELIIIGGAISNNFEQYEPYLATQTAIVTAGALRDKAGIVGAACAAIHEF